MILLICLSKINHPEENFHKIPPYLPTKLRPCTHSLTSVLVQWTRVHIQPSADSPDSSSPLNEGHYSGHFPSFPHYQNLPFLQVFLLTYCYLSNQINKQAKSLSLFYLIHQVAIHFFPSLHNKAYRKSFLHAFSHLSSHSIETSSVRFSFPPCHHSCSYQGHHNLYYVKTSDQFFRSHFPWHTSSMWPSWSPSLLF